MLLADKIKKENIAEYIIYMYQIEDIVRAYNFDIEAIIQGFVKPQLADDSFVNEHEKWFKAIVTQMISQKIQVQGHINDINEIIVELSYLHNMLLTMLKDQKYTGLFNAASKNIEDFKEKSNLKDKNHIEIAFHALYMKFLLRLQKKEISAETEAAFDSMRVMLAYLSKAYHKMKNGDMDFVNN